MTHIGVCHVCHTHVCGCLFVFKLVKVKTAFSNVCMLLAGPEGARQRVQRQ